MNASTARHLLSLGALLAGWCLLAAEQAPQPLPDLTEYANVEKAVTAQVRAAGGLAGQTGYLGATIQRDGKGQVIVEQVQPDSPAAKAGLLKGDAITRVGEQLVKTPEAFREWLQTRGPGESVKLSLLRNGKSMEVNAILAATSRPMRAGVQRVFLGLELGQAKEGEGVLVEQVTADSPAAAAGLKSGDYLAKLDGSDFTRAARLIEYLAEKKPGETLTLVVRRDGKELEVKAALVAERGGGPPAGKGAGKQEPAASIWKKDVFRLAVVCIDYPDVKHNAKVPVDEWGYVFFSRNTYNGRMNPTGQAVNGSLNDYFQEQSHGGLRIEGKVFDWIQVSKKRADYSQGSGTSNKTALPLEAMDKVIARDGKESLKGFDGVQFIYAGDRVQTNRGALYYPHSGSLTHQGRRYAYLLNAEGGSRMSPVSSFAKEMGRVLGLPDLAARTENVGSEGLGAWCAMSNTLTGSQPQHFCAWCKEKLGWIKPAVIDPTVKQKLILGPIEDSALECYKVLVRPDGSEYLLLENRRRKGFDAELPAEGLLIWRVVNDRPILEESHGIEGPSGPTVQLSAVPYPSPANTAFTPDTTPSSRSPQGGGLPVHITDIRRLPDGRIAFQIGFEYR